MHRALKDDQALAVMFHTGREMLRLPDQNVTDVVIPAERARMVFKIMNLASDPRQVRVTVLSTRTEPENTD